MEWHETDAKNLAIIDREIGDRLLSPSEYEIVRRVIYGTADLDYKTLIDFSERALVSAAAALAARSVIIVDVPMVQVGIAEEIQHTFANPIYCCLDVKNLATSPNINRTKVEQGMEVLAKRYPEAIFIIGQSFPALTTLIELIQSDNINPALVIATPVSFLDSHQVKDDLKQSSVPNITIKGRKGNPSVATAIMDALIDLAWQAFGEISKH